MAKKKTKKTTKAASKTGSKKTADKEKLNKLNEMGARKGEDRRKADQTPPGAERRKTKRRRQIDPTTCEREYNQREIEFMHALDEYKRASGRMFPTCSEILEVIQSLGYRQVAEPTEGFSFDKDENCTEESAVDFDADTLEEELEDQLI